MEFTFDTVVIEWRGPAPFYFAKVPDNIAAEVKLAAPTLTYGWGVIPSAVTIGNTTETTSLFPKDGGYLVPLKDALRNPEHISNGDTVTLTLVLGR